MSESSIKGLQTKYSLTKGIKVNNHLIYCSSVQTLVVELTCLLIKVICLLQKLTKISSAVATALYALANDDDPVKHNITADDALVSVTQLKQPCIA